MNARDIFKARAVFVWLGETADNSEDAVDLMLSIYMTLQPKESFESSTRHLWYVGDLIELSK